MNKPKIIVKDKELKRLLNDVIEETPHDTWVSPQQNKSDRLDTGWYIKLITLSGKVKYTIKKDNFDEAKSVYNRLSEFNKSHII